MAEIVLKTEEDWAQFLGLCPAAWGRGGASTEDVAWHEAAHATAAAALRVPVRDVQVRKRGHLGGRLMPEASAPVAVRLVGRDSPEERAARVWDRRREKLIVVALAGPMGDVLRVGKSRGYQGDISLAVKMAFVPGWPPGRRERTTAVAVKKLQRALWSASSLLATHDAAWRRIATELLARRRLTGQELRRLFIGGRS